MRQNLQKEGSLGKSLCEKWDFTQKGGPIGDKISKNIVFKFGWKLLKKPLSFKQICHFQ